MGMRLPNALPRPCQSSSHSVFISGVRAEHTRADDRSDFVITRTRSVNKIPEFLKRKFPLVERKSNNFVERKFDFTSVSNNSPSCIATRSYNGFSRQALDGIEMSDADVAPYHKRGSP